MINTQAFISNNSVSKSFAEIISINQNYGDITTKKENISFFYFLYDVNSHMKDYYVNSLKLIYELINKKANIGIWNFDSNPISEYLELEKKI